MTNEITKTEGLPLPVSVADFLDPPATPAQLKLQQMREDLIADPNVAIGAGVMADYLSTAEPAPAVEAPKADPWIVTAGDWYMKGTSWAGSRLDADWFDSEADATAALRKNAKFMKAGARKIAVVCRLSDFETADEKPATEHPRRGTKAAKPAKPAAKSAAKPAKQAKTKPATKAAAKPAKPAAKPAKPARETIAAIGTATGVKAKILALIQRSTGATEREVCEALGWKKAGATIGRAIKTAPFNVRKEREDGRTRYFADVDGEPQPVAK